MSKQTLGQKRLCGDVSNSVEGFSGTNVPKKPGHKWDPKPTYTVGERRQMSSAESVQKRVFVDYSSVGGGCEGW